jgi:uncharacterized protein YifE (UPF0438 family)
MPIKDVFKLKGYGPLKDVSKKEGYGTVVTGKVETGTIKVADKAEIAGEGKPLVTTRIEGILREDKIVDTATPGDDIGCLLLGVAEHMVKPGQVLLSPGTFDSTVVFSTKNLEHLDTAEDLFKTSREVDIDFKDFTLRCDKSLIADHALEILMNYGGWFEALTAGKIQPIAKAQEHFIEVSRRQAKPSTDPEKIWRMYQNMVAWQSKIDEMDYQALLEYKDSYLNLDERYSYVKRRIREAER